MSKQNPTLRGVERPRKTPWGPADSITRIERGVSWVTTPSHGGLAVSIGRAEKLLSTRAIRVAYPGRFGDGDYIYFEEDCAYAVAFYEHPEWKRFLDVQSLAEWKAADYTNDPHPWKADEPIQRLEAEVAKSDEQIKADMEAIIRHYYPKYFEGVR